SSPSYERRCGESLDARRQDEHDAELGEKQAQEQQAIPRQDLDGSRRGGNRPRGCGGGGGARAPPTVEPPQESRPLSGNRLLVSIPRGRVVRSHVNSSCARPCVRLSRHRIIGSTPQPPVQSRLVNRPRTSGQNSFHMFPTNRPRNPLPIRRTFCGPVVELGGSQVFATRLLPIAPT